MTLKSCDSQLWFQKSAHIKYGSQFVGRTISDSVATIHCGRESLLTGKVRGESPDMSLGPRHGKCYFALDCNSQPNKNKDRWL